MNALKQNDNDISYGPGETKYYNDIKVNYIEPNIGYIYSKYNKVEFINTSDYSGCVSGDLIVFTQNYIGDKFLSSYKDTQFVKVKFPNKCDLKKGDEFICLTKSPYLVNDYIKFCIDKCIKTKESIVDKTNWCDEAKQFLKN
jgi:hypothetical protein